jgi:flagellar biosynthesis/type III secretory pathway M-ring protein FliF/YscJ
MSIVRGLVTSEVLAAALVGGMFIGVAARDLPVEASASALKVSDISVSFIAFPFMAVSFYWLVGVVIWSVWRWVRRIFRREPAGPKDAVAASQTSAEASKPTPPPPMMRTRPSRTHMRSDMVTPRASADFLSRRAKREETQDDAPDADG